MTTTAIVIGCYKLVDFIELNIVQCREIWGGDTPILLSDDLSPQSDAIKALADKHGCAYRCHDKRRSHFSGDMQAFINGLVFARDCGVDLLLKLSQRLIPLGQGFRVVMDEAFSQRDTGIVLPGKLNLQQIARPHARFYANFGMLTDAVGIRSGTITPERVLDCYRERVKINQGKMGAMVEFTWADLIGKYYTGDRARTLPAWSIHDPFKPKLYLRKSQSMQVEYVLLARAKGLAGDYDIREWIQIEGRKGYICRPNNA